MDLDLLSLWCIISLDQTRPTPLRNNFFCLTDIYIEMHVVPIDQDFFSKVGGGTPKVAV